MSRRLQHLLKQHFPALLSGGLIVVVLWQILLAPAYGAELGGRSLRMSSSIASTTSTYQLSFSISTAATLGSIAIEFCSNSPFIQDPCTAPSGASVANVILTSQTGATGFTINSASNANFILLSRPPSPSLVGPVSYTFTNALNPNASGSYYVRLQTFASNNGTGPSNDYGAIAYAINTNLSVSAEVPPYLIFCAAVAIPTMNCSSATGDYINFGELSSVRPSSGTSQLLSATNAKSGYNITISGTTLTSGNDVINPIKTADVSRPGTAQFGLNVRANVSPSSGNDPYGPGSGMPVNNYNLPNFFQFVPGDIIVSAAKPDDLRRYTASYLVNVPSSQAPGVYVSTITYICLGNF